MWLDLSNNKLTSLPVQIGELKSLKWLDLKNNQLSNLPEQISELKNLTKLNLSGNPILTSEQEKIRIWLPKCSVEF
jgi:Leucine-rich repeat (LRR) protein